MSPTAPDVGTAGSLQDAIPFVPFHLERWMATFEHRVSHNLCDSGVQALTARELCVLAGCDPDAILDEQLVYGRPNGSEELRSSIASLYPGAGADQVLVTTGSAEGAFILGWALLRGGDRVVIPSPAYGQWVGMAGNVLAEVVDIPLVLENDWQPDPDAIRAAITPGTRLIVVTNPNNPTASLLPDAAMDAIVECADRVGAWLIADEVYQGAELAGRRTQSFWGRYDRVIVTNSVSKSYGLPGLRLGWVVAPPEVIRTIWQRHDYTVLAPNPTADRLANIALGASNALHERTRRILTANWHHLERTLRDVGGAFTWRAPQAGAICFVRSLVAPRGRLLEDRLREDHSILVAPGATFGAPGFFRVGIGNDPAAYPKAVAALGRALAEAVD